MPKGPNVLLVVTDQERFDVSAPDGPPVRTPGHDRLQAEGMRFDEAYTPTSICSSARASLLTGLYPHNHGMLNNSHGPEAVLRNLPAGVPTFSRSLNEAGYETSYVGKWHVSLDAGPGPFGFDTYLGSDSQAPDETLRAYHRNLGIQPEDLEPKDTLYTGHAEDPTLVSGKLDVPPEVMQAYYYTQLTIDQLEAYAQQDSPFLHRLDFVDPHHPYLVPEPYASMYPPDEIDPWPTYADTFDGKPGLHAEHRRRRGVMNFTWEDWAEAVSKYFGSVSFISDQIDRILEALDAFGLTEDTVVIHTTDHGDFTGSHRQFNKGPLMYQETYHIPLDVRWPGTVEEASVCPELVRLQDLMPTLIEVAGAQSYENPDSRSLVPLLEGKVPSDWPTSLFAEYHGDEFGFYSQRMVKTERYKYVYNAFDVDELYDQEEDPHELHNRVEHPTYRPVRDGLQETMLAWMETTSDPFHEWTAKAFSI